MGIPFAAPPVGNLRFEKPRPPVPWTTPLNATTYPLGCVPCTKTNSPTSEDCLYLRLWTPSLTGSDLPVVVYIHGGAYMGGNGWMGDEQIREVYAQNGIVFLTIQYRLGFLGFLTLNDTRLPANLGLWDQNMALRWVQENIGKFGGNSKKVTIWGTSAGSSSVGQHTVSPQSQGLFAQAFEQSGSPVAYFARGDFNIQAAMNTLVKLNCPTQGDVKGCLRSRTLDEFYGAIGSCTSNDMNFVLLAPMVDGDFFVEQPEKAIQNALVIPTLIGLNQREGRVFDLGTGYAFSIPPEDFNSMSSDKFYMFIENWVANRGYDEQAQAAAKDIFNFYAQNQDNANTSDAYFWMGQFDRLFSDVFFNVPAVREAILKTKAKSPVYAFILDYFNQDTWPIDYPCQGSTHGSESPYCFEVGVNFQPTQDDYTVAGVMQQYIVQFIKTGNPSTASVPFDRFTEASTQYLSLKPQSAMANNLFAESNNFWSNTMKKYRLDFVTRRAWDAH